MNKVFIFPPFFLKVTSDGILAGLCNKGHLKLCQLYLSGINNMTEDTVVKLAQNLPNLTHLDLGYCITAVTDTALQAIFQNQVCCRSHHHWKLKLLSLLDKD